MAINLRLVFIMLVSFASLQLSGCASITGGTQQSISVETRKDAVAVTGAECELTNAKGKWFIASPGSTQIQRSHDPLLITCKKPDYEIGRASVESVARAGMAGNFIFGGLIGVAIDHSSGAAYDYPNLIQVSMGQSNVISYSYEKGAAPGSVTVKPAQTVSNAPGPDSPAFAGSNSQDGVVTVANSLVLNADGTTTPVAAVKGDVVKSESVKPSPPNTETAKLGAAKKRCVELGFLPQTEPYGQCMLRVSK